jgi:hypothetical protein
MRTSYSSQVSPKHLIFFPHLFLCFYSGQGLASYVWRNWNNLSGDEQNYLTNCILQTLVSSTALSTFVRSKIEQVLASICAVSGSLTPVLSIVVEFNQPGFEFGISALRTVFEEILKDDLRILPSQKTLLYEAASEVQNFSLLSLASPLPLTPLLRLLSLSLH